VSDLVWLDHANYDLATSKGSVGVEFAGTTVSSQIPYGQNLSLAQSVNYSTSLIADNQELQWSEVYYRSYFELRVSKQQVDAEYFGLPTTINHNPHEISLANFTVMNDANALKRVSGATAMGSAVENGAVKFGKTVQTTITSCTDTGLYSISHDNQEDL
jgi:alkaline phosphatase D